MADKYITEYSIISGCLAFEGWNFIKRTFIATVSLSVSLYVLPEMTIAGDDIFLSALFGGILSGVGTGILFAVHALQGARICSQPCSI